MSVIHLENNDFKKEVLDSKIPVIVDFFATWCGPCKRLGPVFEGLSEKRSDVKFVKVDVDQHNELAGEMEVMSVPTLILFKDGNVVSTVTGALPESQLSEFIDSAIK